MCCTITSIQKHCKDEHSWINIQKRGRDACDKQAHSKNKLWECNCAYQRFFKVGKWQKYFEVVANSLKAITEHTTNQKHLFFEAQKEDVKKTASDLAEAANII